jgi:predicted neuraminidase
MRLKKGARKWSTPEVIADTPFLGEGNGVAWQAPDGLVWLFYVQRYGDTWSDSRVLAKISRDGARTWSDNFVIGFAPGTMTRARPIVLSDGNYLLPVYHETGHDREFTAADTASYFLLHDPVKRTWTPTGRILSEKGNLQPEAVEIAPGHLVAYCRRGGDYLPTTQGWLIRAESHDGGRTWTRGENSAFPNPNAAVSFIRLASGNLLLVYNDSMNDRNPLTAALSEDLDKSWPYKRNLAEDNRDYAYPMAIQTEDGRIHLIYTQDERQTVMHAVFDEDWVRGR